MKHILSAIWLTGSMLMINLATLHVGTGWFWFYDLIAVGLAYLAVRRF